MTWSYCVLVLLSLQPLLSPGPVVFPTSRNLIGSASRAALFFHFRFPYPLGHHPCRRVAVLPAPRPLWKHTAFATTAWETLSRYVLRSNPSMHPQIPVRAPGCQGHWTIHLKLSREHSCQPVVLTHPLREWLRSRASVMHFLPFSHMKVVVRGVPQPKYSRLRLHAMLFGS